MFEAAYICTTLHEALLPFKAMVLLSINGGFGNSNCGTFPLSAVNLEDGWNDHPRSKTGVERRYPQWSKTVEVVHEATDSRPKIVKDGGDELVFLTRCGLPWAKQTNANSVSREFHKLGELMDPKAAEKNREISPVKLHRPELECDALRHTFETIGGKSRDQVAVDHIMGHEISLWPRIIGNAFQMSVCGLLWTTFTGGCSTRTTKSRNLESGRG